MDIEYKGGNCIVITTKQGTVATDPKLSHIGLKDITNKISVQLTTHHDFQTKDSAALLIDGPGEYEAAGLSIKGVAAQRAIDTPEQGNMSTIYRLDSSDVSIAVIGHINAKLSDAQLEALGVIDILVVPVGGNGYTLDAHAAVEMVRQIEPKIVIPTHYEDASVTYEVPQAGLDVFMKEIGVTPEVTPKLKLKAGVLPDLLTVYELTRTS